MKAMPEKSKYQSVKRHYDRMRGTTPTRKEAGKLERAVALALPPFMGPRMKTLVALALVLCLLPVASAASGDVTGLTQAGPRTLVHATVSLNQSARDAAIVTFTATWAKRCTDGAPGFMNSTTIKTVPRGLLKPSTTKGTYNVSIPIKPAAPRPQSDPCASHGVGVKTARGSRWELSMYQSACIHVATKAGLNLTAPACRSAP